MDLFLFWLHLILIVLESGLLYFFAGRFTGKERKAWQYVIYLLVLLLGDRAAAALDSHLLALGVSLLTLYGVNRLFYHNNRSVSCVVALLAFYVSQLSFGVVNSLMVLLTNRMMDWRLHVLTNFVSMLLALTLCACCFKLILRWFSLREERRGPYPWILLPPALFFFAVEFFIMRIVSSAMAAEPSLNSQILALLVLQLLGMGAFLSALYAYKRLCDGFRAQASFAALKQEAHAQRAYVTEAQMRYEQTRAFRHDIKNHLSVLNGLLKSRDYEQAHSYLQTLDSVTEDLSLPFHTGSPVVDILLRDKLGLARAEGIEAEVSLSLPQPCGVEELDFCVIFSNALDNAIHACTQVEGPKSIRITGERQCDFFMLEFENTCAPGPDVVMGTGLSNIKAVAEKYSGAITLEKAAATFRLNVLLNIS